MCLLFSLIVKLNGLLFSMETAVGITAQVSEYLHSFHSLLNTWSDIFLPSDRKMHILVTWNSAGILCISVSSLRGFKREYEDRFGVRNLNLHSLCTEICLSSARAV